MDDIHLMDDIQLPKSPWIHLPRTYMPWKHSWQHVSSISENKTRCEHICRRHICRGHVCFTCRGNTPGNTSPLLGTTRTAADTSVADTKPAVDMSAAPAADDRASTYGNTWSLWGTTSLAAEYLPRNYHDNPSVVLGAQHHKGTKREQVPRKCLYKKEQV